MTRLVVGYPGALPVSSDGSVLIDEKLRSGVARYRDAWPGGDVVLAAPSGALDGRPGLGTQSRRLDDLGFELVLGATWREALDRAAGDLHLLPLVHRLAEVEHLVPRSVLTIEFTPEDLTATDRRGSHGLVSRARIAAGGQRRRRQFESWVRTARGIQCNGHPAHERFDHLSPSALLFFDTRLSAEHVALARACRREAPSGPVRLCFSGRLIEGKGPRHALEVVPLLQRAGIDCTLDVIGVGPLEADLRRSAGPAVRFLDGMDFASSWTAYVREEVDLMVLPHTQGDPSGTYLEAAGCGVPVVGFDNVALASLVRHHGLGATAPLGDDEALAATAHGVLTDPSRWSAIRARGLDFMEEHSFEREADRRLEHLVGLST